MSEPRGLLDGLIAIQNIMASEGVPYEIARERWKESLKDPPPDNVIYFRRRTDGKEVPAL